MLARSEADIIQGDTIIYSPWHLHRWRHTGADNEHIPWTSDKATCLDSLGQTPKAHLPAGSIRITTPRTSPRERRLCTKPDAQRIHRHLHRSEHNPLVSFFPHFSTKYLVQILSIRTMRVRWEPHRHSESRQYVYFHPVCRS